MSARPEHVVHAQHGVAAVEFALVLVLLVTIVFGITELGRALYQYDTLTKAARAAARFAAVYDGEANPGVADRAVCVAIAGSPWLAAGGAGCAAPPVVAGLSPANVRVEGPETTPTLRSFVVQDGAGGSVGTLDLVRVTISDYRFRTLVPFVIPDIAFGDIVAYMPKNAF
jgi:Flp pilus assembly pilin Flp